MNENEINNHSLESDSEPSEEWGNQEPDNYMELTSSSSDQNDNEEPQDGLTFKWVNLFWGVAIFIILSQGNIFSGDWRFYIYLAIVVIIHELGHVVVGKSFGCHIKELQVFFLPFVSYKSQQVSEGNSWKNIKWSLGVLPLGGVTVFKSRKLKDENDEFGVDDVEAYSSATATPYIEDKPAWQRLLISAAGVLFNIATFAILYIALPYLSVECDVFLRPLMVISLLLAVLNILPIYPLDGGAIVFALYEMITGSKPSPAFTNICGWIGFVFIILFFWVFPEWLNGILDRIFSMFF